MSGSWYCWQGKALILHIRVQPGASRDEIAGPHGRQLKIRLRAHPVDGRANAGLIRFLAGVWGVAKRNVEILSGAFDRDKRVRVDAPRSVPEGVEPIPRYPLQ